jgi:sodium-coupled neutral amino acid transporter 6
VLLGASIIVVILIVAILVPNVRNVFGAAGATSSVSLMAILPGLFYNYLHRDSTDPAVRWHMRSSLVFAVFGAIVGVVSLAGVIMSWVSAA